MKRTDILFLILEKKEKNIKGRPDLDNPKKRYILYSLLVKQEYMDPQTTGSRSKFTWISIIYVIQMVRLILTVKKQIFTRVELYILFSFFYNFLLRCNSFRTNTP